MWKDRRGRCGGWAWKGRVSYRPGFEPRGHCVTSLGRRWQWKEPTTRVKTSGSAPDFPCFLFRDLGEMPFL